MITIIGDACHQGTLRAGQELTFSSETGSIEYSSLDGSAVGMLSQTEKVVLEDGDTIAPGLLELQTNGLGGVHFTTLTDADYEVKLTQVARQMATSGVTGWYATVPTVPQYRWREILPLLRPRSFERGSPLLGAHVEGPYLHASKKGAHNDEFFRRPSIDDCVATYGLDNLQDTVKLITVAPELEGALGMIAALRSRFPHIVVSIGHTSATYEQALDAVSKGARCITHIFNAMNPLNHREPGVPGLMSLNPSSPALPYYSIIPDSVHLHPNVLRICYQANPDRCISITDSIELAGLSDGVYPPNGQITYPQRKLGNRATNVADSDKGEKETLIGSCITLPEGIRILVNEAGLTLAQAVKSASTNIAGLMMNPQRGTLKRGYRADFVVFDKQGHVKQTWVGGKLLFNRADV